MGTYVITEPCIGCKDGTCVDVCPVACIHTTPDSPQYYIDPAICIECEQCVIVCPVDAIFSDTDVPAKWAEYADINALFFRANKPAINSISESESQRLIQIVKEYAFNQKLAVSVVVVDENGNVVASQVINGADMVSLDQAKERALTSARARAKRAGAVPLLDDLTIVGVVAVAGADREHDGLCCQAAIGAWEKITR